MNADRRKQIAKAQGLIAEAHAIIDQCASDERDYYDNMPDSLRDGDKGNKADEYATTLEEWRDQLDEMQNADFSE